MSIESDFWSATKETLGFSEWNWRLCRRADFAGRLWPNNRIELYESGATIDEALAKDDGQPVSRS